MKLFGQTASLFSTTHSVPKAWAESKGWSPSLYHQPWAEKVISMNFKPRATAEAPGLQTAAPKPKACFITTVSDSICLIQANRHRHCSKH